MEVVGCQPPPHPNGMSPGLQAPPPAVVVVEQPPPTVSWWWNTWSWACVKQSLGGSWGCLGRSLFLIMIPNSEAFGKEKAHEEPITAE